MNHLRTVGSTRRVSAALAMALMLLLGACSGDDASTEPVARLIEPAERDEAPAVVAAPSDSAAVSQSLDQSAAEDVVALDGYNTLTRPEQFEGPDQLHVLTTDEYEAFIVQAAAAKQQLIDTVNAMPERGFFLMRESEADEVWLFRDLSSGDHLSLGTVRGAITDTWVLVPRGFEQQYKERPELSNGRIFRTVPQSIRLNNRVAETSEGGETFDTAGQSSAVVFLDDGTLDFNSSVFGDQQLDIDRTPHQLSRAEATAFLNLIANVQQGLTTVASQGG